MSTFRKRKFIDENFIYSEQKKNANDSNFQPKTNMIYMQALQQINFQIQTIERKITELDKKIENKIRDSRRVEQKLDALDKKLTDVFEFFQTKKDIYDIEDIIEQLKTVNIFEEKKKESIKPVNNYQMSYIN